MGKFGLPYLKAASDLLFLFQQNSHEIQRLQSLIKSRPPCLEQLYDLDEISNLSSLTGDISQAISDLFPHESWKEASDTVTNQMFILFDDLNKDHGLYTSLLSLKNSFLFPSLTQSQQLFAISLLKEFEKEGTHLTDSIVKDHSLNILKLQSQYLNNIDFSKAKLLFAFEEIESIPMSLIPERLGDKYDDLIEVEYDKEDLLSIVNHSESPKIRERAWKASGNVNISNKAVLKSLISERKQLANSLGFENFAEYSMQYKMFSGNVKELIENLVACHGYLEPKLKNEYDIILDRKALNEQISRKNPVKLEGWDISYYSQRYIDEIKTQKLKNFTKHYNDENFFTFFNIFEGIKELCSSLFGISIEICMANTDEAWSNDIVKLAFSKNGSLIGYLYMDLFQRNNKANRGASNYNIVCPKKVSINSNEHQIPISVLSCNFSRPAFSKESLYVTLDDFKNQGITYNNLIELFHELGHSIHSLVSQSEFQAFSGTRVPLDLAEIPSHIFEKFVTDYNYVSRWALHKLNNEKIPNELFLYMTDSIYIFKALKNHIQLSFSLFDLLIHSEENIDAALQKFNGFFETKEFGGDWYCNLHHLAEYGSSYYTYVLDNALSAVIWETAFKKSAINAEAGNLLYKHLLIKGGSEPGKTQIGNILSPYMVSQEGVTNINDIDPFLIMQHWYRTHFKDHELVILEDLRAKY
ncbi:unnamed protein product [Blepharisma stoltei]|uniref:Peptidase M3A/M3B catalytic domain-containing protein n=1 Tax=Blepharisma stoltei TaxID=1481888 RepID=A0AAU9JB31_9CILI|nr:unnamed protein product [Blepharisma stoltei]